MQPPLSVDELAALWIEAAKQISPSVDPINDPEQSLEILARVSFDVFCQSFIEKVLGSDLMLSLDSRHIQKLVRPTFNAMGPTRSEGLRKLTSVVASNASRLAKASLLMSQYLRNGEASGALKHAISAVRRRRDLNDFEKRMAEEWLSTSAKTWGQR